jgi:hypothetical protein
MVENKFIVGDIFKLKVECLYNPIGTIGVCYAQYDNGISVIFENGKYDGFSLSKDIVLGGRSEVEMYLEKINHSEELSDYYFKNVIRLTEDFRKGYFHNAFNSLY